MLAAPAMQRLALAGFVAVLALVAPALLLLDWHQGLAGMGDDSVSYLIQAQVYAGTADAAVRAWAGTATHFPPLFPLLLAACGASQDLLRAHLVVAACAGAALLPIFAFVARVAGDRRAALAVVLVFLATPTAWISTLGILSDPPYLLVSFLALALAPRDGPERSTRALLGYGALLAAALLVRSAGIALVAAYAVHAGLRAVRREAPWRAVGIPLGVVACAQIAWMALRVPLVGENYGLVLHNVGAWIARDAPGFFAAMARQLAGGWIASFAAEPDAATGVRWACLALGACALAGAARAAWKNRLDGWYALAYVAMLCAWLFPQEILRRLLYPLLPLAILHAGEALYAAARALRASRAHVAPAVAAALVLLLALPALVATAQRAGDRAPVLEGSPLSYSGMTIYYTTVAESYAHVQAGREMAALAGFARIAHSTPPDARVMWMRPDYVALLSGRAAEPWYQRDGLEVTLRRMRERGVTHVVLSPVTKGDLDADGADVPFITAQSLAPYTRAIALSVPNPARPSERFSVVEIDREALARGVPDAAAPARQP